MATNQKVGGSNPLRRTMSVLSGSRVQGTAEGLFLCFVRRYPMDPKMASGVPPVEKACETAGFFLWNVFSRTCAEKKHRSPSNFRKNLAKPARRPEPRHFWAAPRVRRMAREPAGRATRAYPIKWGPRKTCFVGAKPGEAVFRQSPPPEAQWPPGAFFVAVRSVYRQAPRRQERMRESVSS